MLEQDVVHRWHHHRLGYPRKSDHQVRSVTLQAPIKVTYHVERNESIELDEAVEIAKYNRQGKVYNVRGVASEEAHELHNFGKGKHENELQSNGPKSLLGSPIAS